MESRQARSYLYGGRRLWKEGDSDRARVTRITGKCVCQGEGVMGGTGVLKRERVEGGYWGDKTGAGCWLLVEVAFDKKSGPSQSKERTKLGHQL